MVFYAPLVRGAMAHHVMAFRMLFRNIPLICPVELDSSLGGVRISKGRFKFLWAVSPFVAWRVSKFARENGSNKLFVLNGEFIPHIFFIILFCRIFKIKVYVTWHDYSPHTGKFFNKIYWFMALLVSLAADRVVFLNDRFFGQWGRRFLSRVTPGIFLPFPAISEFISPVHSDPLPRARDYLFYFGRLESYKGLDRLVNLKWMLPDTDIVVLGQGDNNIAIKLQGAGIQVIGAFVSDEELSALIKGSSGVVMPYRHGSQSNNPSMVSRFGVPLFVSKDVFFDMDVLRVGGHLVDFSDPSMLVQKIHVGSGTFLSSDPNRSLRVLLEFLL